MAKRPELDRSDLWLPANLECWYEADGKRVRLDDDYEPAPPAPAPWVAALQQPSADQAASP